MTLASFTLDDTPTTVGFGLFSLTEVAGAVVSGVVLGEVGVFVFT